MTAVVAVAAATAAVAGWRPKGGPWGPQRARMRGKAKGSRSSDV